MLDSNGFYHLTPKVDITKYSSGRVSTGTKEKKSKSKEPKFKKGSWKAVLYKKLKKWKSSKYVEDFHFVKAENLIVYSGNGDSLKAESFHKLMKKSRLKRLREKHGYVLLYAYDDTYTKLSIDSYLKLMDVDKIVVEFHLSASFDGQDECDVYENTTVIDNINDLMSFINQHRAGINGVYEIQANCCCFTDYTFKMKIVVRFNDGSVKTYKSDMNDFMKDFGIRRF